MDHVSSHYADKMNKRDILLRYDGLQTIILYDVTNDFNIITTFENYGVNAPCFFYGYNEGNIRILAHKMYETFRVFDEMGNCVREFRSELDDCVDYTETFIDKQKKYVICATYYNGICAFEFEKGTLFRKFEDKNLGKSITFNKYCIVVYLNNVLKLLESDEYSNFRVWDFYKGTLLSKIILGEKSIRSIIKWNKKNIIVSNEDKIKLIELEKMKVIKDIGKHEGYVLGMDVVNTKNDGKH